MERKSYGEFCALARALDHVGERWTLLVVRELLLRPMTFRDLHSRLAGLSPALLVTRIRGLVDDGLVERNDAPPRSKAVVYRLTPAGAALEPAILELIRWGARWMTAGVGADRVDAAWALLAVRALLDGTALAAPVRGTVHVAIDDTWVTIDVRNGRRTVHAGRQGNPAAVVAGAAPELLATVAGFTTVGATGAGVEGDPVLARAALEPAAPPRGANSAAASPAPRRGRPRAGR